MLFDRIQKWIHRSVRAEKAKSNTTQKECRLFIVESRNLLFRIYSLETITGVAYRYHK